MDQQGRAVICSDNEELAAFLLNKRQELAKSPKGISENLDMTLSKAYINICNSKTPINSLKDLSQIKGVGKWILKQMQEFFGSNSGGSEPVDPRTKGKKPKEVKRYVPQKNSVAYALLITLYRGTANGTEFMRKQELIDATEASGLSRVPIAPEKGKGKPVPFGSSPSDWYSGWSGMTTLIKRGLVVKSSCPAKYMLTQEGKESAGECLLRSGLTDHLTKNLDNAKGCSDLESCRTYSLGVSNDDSDIEVISPSIGICKQKKSIDVPSESLERFLEMGYSKEQVLCAFTEVSKDHQNKEISSLWPAVLCRLREDHVYGLQPDLETVKPDLCAILDANTSKYGGQVDIAGRKSRWRDSSCDSGHISNSYSTDSGPSSFTLRACSSSDHNVRKSTNGGFGANINILSIPPLNIGERFEDAYEVVLILDDREHFAAQGSRSRRIIENIRSQFKIAIEVRRLPVGDGIWIARHKDLGSEYVLDFIVERKNVDDLRSSIRDNRYRDQKLRLLRCGLKKLIYLVEGDPNSSEAAESIKTACFTTEILEGFDVQRTSGLADTLKKYGYITKAISQYYRSELPEDLAEYSAICPPFDEFVKRCQDLDKVTVSDVFAIQLMQVPHVTEEVAIAVLDMYPTLLSLARAYSLLDGDIGAQEEMLKKQSNNVVNAVASRNIFQLVWGNGQ